MINQNILSKVKYLCYDVYITIDNQVFSLDFNPRKETLNGGSYGYYVHGKFRSNKWIADNRTNVEEFITL